MAQDELKKYYKKIFKEYYRTEEEANIIGEHTYEFAYYVMEHPEVMEPLYKFFVDISFEGPDGGFTKPLIQKVMEEHIYTGSTMVDIEVAICKEIISALSSQAMEENEIFKEEIFEILEDIRKKDSTYLWYELDWNFFIMQMEAMKAFHILFQTLNSKKELTLFGQMFAKKAKECGMDIAIQGMPEDVVQNMMAAHPDQAEKIKASLANRTICFLNFELLGDFSNKGPTVIKLTEEDMKRYENH